MGVCFHLFWHKEVLRNKNFHYLKQGFTLAIQEGFNMSKLKMLCVFLLLNLSLPLALNGQVLEKYQPLKDEVKTFDYFENSEILKYNVDLQSFPLSELYVKVPLGSTVFIDSVLWFQTARDTIFQIPISSLKERFKELEKEQIQVSVINKKLDREKVKILKGYGKLILDEEKINGEDTFLIRRKVSKFDDFFYLSLLIPLLLLSFFKIIYPQFLKTITSPLDVFSGDDFSDASYLVKFFSIHIVFYLIIVNMFLVATGMLVFKELYIDQFNQLIEDSLNQYFFYWLLGTILLTIVSLLKFLYLKLMAYVFKMEKFSFSHYFYVLRILSIFSLITIAIIYVVKQNNFGDLSIIMEWVLLGSFWMYVFIILMLFFIIMNKASYKIFHLFAYICMSELIPFLIISKLIVG
jgi:hypothetical protein